MSLHSRLSVPVDPAKPVPGWFRYRQIGDRIYEVRDKYGMVIGRIYTDARVAISENPKRWFASGLAGEYDSMDEAARRLLENQEDACGEYPQWLIERKGE